MKKIIDYCGNALMYVLTIIQTKEIFQIISLVLSIVISTIIVIEKIILWYKTARSDGKITNKEISEIANTIKEDIKDIKENADEIIEIVEIQNKEEK